MSENSDRLRIELVTLDKLKSTSTSAISLHRVATARASSGWASRVVLWAFFTTNIKHLLRSHVNTTRRDRQIGVWIGDWNDRHEPEHILCESLTNGSMIIAFDVIWASFTWACRTELSKFFKTEITDYSSTGLLWMELPESVGYRQVSPADRTNRIALQIFLWIWFENCFHSGVAAAICSSLPASQNPVWWWRTSRISCRCAKMVSGETRRPEKRLRKDNVPGSTAELNSPGIENKLAECVGGRQFSDLQCTRRVSGDWW